MFTFFKPKTIIFLDLDGVLNDSDDIEIINNNYFPKLEKKFIDLFNLLPKSNVVLHSSWRKNLTLKEIKFLFKYKNIKHKFIDITDKDKSKSDSIKDYISLKQIDDYIILEDDKDVVKYFNTNEYVLTENGLTKENINLINKKTFE